MEKEYKRDHKGVEWKIFQHRQNKERKADRGDCVIVWMRLYLWKSVLVARGMKTLSSCISSVSGRRLHNEPVPLNVKSGNPGEAHYLESDRSVEGEETFLISLRAVPHHCLPRFQPLDL